jgi:hypothetical protein
VIQNKPCPPCRVPLPMQCVGLHDVCIIIDHNLTSSWFLICFKFLFTFQYLRHYVEVLNGEFQFTLLYVCLIVLNATFNNISVISWRSVWLVEETTDLSQVTDKLYHIMLYTSPWSRFELTTSVVIGTDCIGSCKSNYHTITATAAPKSHWMKYDFN